MARLRQLPHPSLPAEDPRDSRPDGKPWRRHRPARQQTRHVVVAFVLLVHVPLLLTATSTGLQLAAAQRDVHNVARSTASAASHAHDPDAATATAHATVAAVLNRHSPACHDLALAVDTSAWQNRRQVHVAVYCTASTRGLALPLVPPHWTLTGTATTAGDER